MHLAWGLVDRGRALYSFTHKVFESGSLLCASTFRHQTIKLLKLLKSVYLVYIYQLESTWISKFSMHQRKMISESWINMNQLESNRINLKQLESAAWHSKVNQSQWCLYNIYYYSYDNIFYYILIILLIKIISRQNSISLLLPCWYNCI